MGKTTNLSQIIYSRIFGIPVIPVFCIYPPLTIVQAWRSLAEQRVWNRCILLEKAERLRKNKLKERLFKEA